MAQNGKFWGRKLWPWVAKKGLAVSLLLAIRRADQQQ
jgi:hypothetical protein